MLLHSKLAINEGILFAFMITGGNMDEKPEEDEKPEQEDKKEGDMVEVKVEKQRLRETFEALRNSENVDSILSYLSSHTKDTIFFGLLFIALLGSFWYPFVSSFFVGGIVGYYFYHELYDLFLSLKQHEEVMRKWTVAQIVVGALACFLLFLHIPGFFLGMILFVPIKHFLHSYL